MFETREEDKPKMLQQKKSAEECFEVEFSMFFFSYLTWITKWKERKKNEQTESSNFIAQDQEGIS